MLKYIYAVIIAAIVITCNVIWGSAITWFLSVSILCIIFFFIIQLSLEDIVNAIFQKKHKDIQNNPSIGHKLYQFGKKWELILKFSALSIVFISGVVCIYITSNPSGKSPWFLNNDYHGISNKAIAFNKNLALQTSSTDSNIINGTLIFSNNGTNNSIQFNEFYIPVLKVVDGRKTTLLNNIYNSSIQKEISFKHKDFQLQLQLETYHPNFFKKIFAGAKNSLLIKGQLSCSNQELLQEWNINAPYQDNFEVSFNQLQYGISFFELLLNGKSFESSKEETYQVLEHLLHLFGDSYVLVDYSNTTPQYKFFPGKTCIENNIQVSFDGQLVQPNTRNSASIANREQFYIGITNHRKLLYLGESGIDKFTNALHFDYPNTYMLKSPSKQELGNKNIRFVTNDFNNIIDQDLKEGFLFNTYNLKTSSAIAGAIDYYAGAPNTALALNIVDYYGNNALQPLQSNSFTLHTKDNAAAYIFQLRDFSINGFSPEKSALYLGLIFISFIALIFIAPGKKLERIEPIILMVIMALTTLRFILYWRVATFPPLENISKHELENTLLNFDFNLGFTLPIPLTVIWVMVFVLGLILYRKGIFKNLVQLFPQQIFSRFNTVTLQYITFIVLCYIAFYINKKILHIEFLTRIINILIPMIGYVYFSGKANASFIYQPKPLLWNGKKKWLEHLHAYVYYFFSSPTTIITLTTIAFFALTDRGFAILFFLFLLLKNILVNFLKKPLANTKISIANRLFQAQHFWIYGISALIIYLIMLAYKPLFFYMLTYKVWLIFGLCVIASIVIWSMIAKEKIRKISIIVTVLFGLIAAIPFTNKWLDHQLNDVVKHVQYRASIIYQPIHELLQSNEYTSFKTQKIIETAENQWFINSYISKPYNNDETINLRAHSRIGVDYSTQTRDVVLPRYIISEWGDFSMYLILALLILPMVFYLIAYNITLVYNDTAKRNVSSYTGLIPLLILFTIGLFVWLTATNRFVFFGQDFPFLSLTSKLSVLLPIALWFITLTQQPTPKHSFQVDLKNNSIKYVLFLGLIAVFALTTVKENELNNENFSIVMEQTKEYIEHDLNGILNAIQDEMDVKREKITYNKLIKRLSNDTNFIALKEDIIKDKYSKSILENLVSKPATAFQLNNPLFMVYDNGRYNAVYNKNLYLELPPIESRKIWQGNILESIQTINAGSALVHWGKQNNIVSLPFISHNPIDGVQLAILPKYWIHGAQDNVGILNMMNTATPASVFIYKNSQKNMIQNATSFATTLEYDDVATIYKDNKSFPVGFESEGNKYATNKWINGNYKIIYPLKERNFWIYSYANAIRSAYSKDGLLLKNNYITIDYDLSLKVQELLNQDAKNRHLNKFSNFAMSVIGADGDGHIRYMNDYVSNRKIIDPNDQSTIFAMQRQQFFYSNAKNERDQWGNRNLLNLYLGPGSSIKGLTIAAIASQVNAGWEQLFYTPPTGDRDNFAGLKLVKPWKNDEHYFGTMGIPAFLAHSSNYYHLLLMYLGSYTKEDFAKDNQYKLSNVLTKEAGTNNQFPIINYSGSNYYFKNLKTKGWPATDKSNTHTSYFGNENSLIANGFEYNLGLRTKDKDKLDRLATTNDKVNFVDSSLYHALSNNSNAGYLWSFPEESFFLQADRAYKDIHQNASIGVMTPSLGGYPLKITPYKMAEMYLSLFTQNKNVQLSIVPQNREKEPWIIDESWRGQYAAFLASQVYKGLSDVIIGGTAGALNGVRSQYPQYYFYAKTGTINEQSSGRKSSRRLVVIISDKDLTKAENVGKNKAYTLYFATDNTQNFDWPIVNEIIRTTINSKSFKHYFNK